MSDPVANDYSSVSPLSEGQKRTAVHDTVLRDDRRGFSRADTLELLDMLGLLDTAWEMGGRAGPVPSMRPSGARGAVRDGIGRLRTSQPPATTPPRTSPPLQDGERHCGCPGVKHVLTPYESPTTYVDPRGKRQCKVGVELRRRKAAGLPAEGPRMCHNGLHPKDGSGGCAPCRAERKRERRAAAAKGSRPCGTGEHDLNVDGRQRADNGCWYCRQMRVSAPFRTHRPGPGIP